MRRRQQTVSQGYIARETNRHVVIFILLLLKFFSGDESDSDYDPGRGKKSRGRGTRGKRKRKRGDSDYDDDPEEEFDGYTRTTGRQREYIRYTCTKHSIYLPLSSSYKESSVEAEGDNKMAAGDGAALPQEEDNREKIDRVRHIVYLLLFYRFIIIFRFYLKDLGQLVVIKLLIYYFL